MHMQYRHFKTGERNCNPSVQEQAHLLETHGILKTLSGKSSCHEDVTEEVVDREDNEVDFLLPPWHTAFNQLSNKQINCHLHYQKKKPN